MFAEFDTDGSGVIEFGEFHAGVARYLQGVPDSQIKALFVSYDADGSGAVSVEEFSSALLGLAPTKAAVLHCRVQPR